MTLYKTQQWKGNDQKNYWYEYKLEKNEIRKYLCHKETFFEDNAENTIGQIIESYSVNAPNMPEEFRQYLP